MYTKEQILDEIKRIALKLGVTSLKRNDFQKNSRISLSTVSYHYGSWNKAVKEAGLTPTDNEEILKSMHKKNIIEDSALLSELVRLYNDYNTIPTESLINSKGKYSTRPYKKRWGNISNAFKTAQKEFNIDLKNYQEGVAIKVNNDNNSLIERMPIIPETIKLNKQKPRNVIYGEPINFRGLQYAPVNEQGVVYLFGMISLELGFLIESIRTGYPDCEGKRCFDKINQQWEHVKIEFEYNSKNFIDHGHNPDECDIIVCWLHDWQDCPIEVLELKSVIKYLKS